jgi:hypothetical protein
MSESAKSRFAVDLGEFERQIAQAHSAQAQSTPAGRHDPLAELARIVGQDDPFQSLLANDAPARPRNQASANLDDIFATREPVAPAQRTAQPQGGRGVEMPAYDPYAQQPQAHAGHAGYGYQAAPSQGQGGYDQADYADEYYDDHAGQHAGQYEAQEDMHYESPRKPRSRKGILAIGAVAGAIVLGAGGAFLLGGNTTALTGGEPPLIKANADPVKVQPQNPGGVEIPNQNKQIYERADQSGDTKVVNREEQPVDVKQAVRINGGSSAESTGATASHASAPTQQQAGGLNLGEPRKVRTVAIRPDGTMARPEGQQPPRPSPVPTMALPAAAQATPAANVASAQPKPAATTPAATPAPKPVAAAATPASDASPQRVASVQPVAPAAAPEVTATGGFAVQLGVSGSESQAQSALEQYQRKYSDLEGLPPLIRKAEVNGNTVYRVRVGPMSRDEASSLCSKLQGQGGQCFVAKN